MKIERSMTETMDEAMKADDCARACAVELMDALLANRAASPEYRARLELPMPGALEYGQLAVALDEGSHLFTPSRLTAFNRAWADHFYARTGVLGIA